MEEERVFLRDLHNSFWNWYNTTVVSGIQRMVSRLPDEILSLQADSNRLHSSAKLGSANVGEIVVVEEHLPLIKLYVLTERRRLATGLDEQRKAISAPELLEHLDDRLLPFKDFMAKSWFPESETRRLPRFSDFVTVERAEQWLLSESGIQLLAREYDEKFHILQSPSLFLPDLEFYRESCALRGRGVGVAYVDIDGFKAFNEKYGEDHVDRHLLPKFMGAVEAHVYAHGCGYRKGGDEYLVLLPNVDQGAAIRLLDSLQKFLANLEYKGIDERTPVSVGLCVLNADSFLTNREAEERANNAKRYAKKKGKNCIAFYEGTLFRDEDLRIADT